jgi:hypothetical protein
MRVRGLFIATAFVLVAVATGLIAARTLQQTGAFSSKVIAQPILFPHDRHAGIDQIPCMYCHYSADRSVDAGMPAVEVCAGCHIGPAGTLNFLQESLELAKLIAYWETQTPIPWVRIYKIPDHARFPHMRHMNAGLTCQECHGPVETMPEIVQWPSLQMGWCVDCHRQREVRTDCAICHY